MYSHETISKRLRGLRLSAGLTLAEVATAVNKSTSAISGYETGRRYPDPQTMIALLDFYKIASIEDFFDFKELQKKSLNTQEKELLHHFRRINTQQKILVIEIVKNFEKD